MDIREGVTFDDVLLVPKYSKVTSRSDTDLSTKLSKNISLNMPLISANMDTVTEIITQITGGIRSGLSYCGASNIKQMQENAEFIKISRAGFAESQSHDVDIM